MPSPQKKGGKGRRRADVVGDMVGDATKAMGDRVLGLAEEKLKEAKLSTNPYVRTFLSGGLRELADHLALEEEEKEEIRKERLEDLKTRREGPGMVEEIAPVLNKLVGSTIKSLTDGAEEEEEDICTCLGPPHDEECPLYIPGEIRVTED